MKKIIYNLILISLLFVNFSFAEKVTDLKATDYVNDYTGTLTADQKLQLSTTLGNLEKQTGDQVAVFVINSMEGVNGRPDYVEHFAVALYQQLGLSTKDKQTGTLFLISKNDHSMRIEVGYGLESTLTDGITKNILDNDVTPSFKNGDYYTGITNGVNDIATVLNGGVLPDNGSLANNSGDNSNSNSGELFQIIIFLIVFGANAFVWLAAIMARSKSWWLGGVVGAVFGAIIYFVFLSSILGIGLWILITILGTVFDYFVSKNYLYYKNNPHLGGPSFWAGGGWGPGSGGISSRGGSGFGGFGGGGFSGGGGSSGSW